MPQDFDEKFNIILLGDIDVGKTSILLRFAEQEFITDTEGIEQKFRDITVDNKICRISLTDTAGQERFRTLTSSFYRNASAMIFVYDITSKESFENVSGHAQDGARYTKKAIQFLVGNKIDLIKKRAVTEAQGQELAESLGVHFEETSAKSGHGIEDLFHMVAKSLMDRANEEITTTDTHRHGKKNCIIS